MACLNSLTSSPLYPFGCLQKEINSVTVAEDLGLCIDQSLTYNDHITKTVSTCLHKLIQINRIKHLLDKKTILLLINSFVFSRLYYCSTVWSNTSKRSIKKLQLVQNFVARIVLDLKKYDHISQGIRSLNWLRVNDKLYLNDAIMINKLVPDYLIGKFTLCSQTHSRNTRQSGQLHLPRCRTGQRSFTYRSAKLWNNLEDDVKSLDSVNVFSKRLVNLLLSD